MKSNQRITAKDLEYLKLAAQGKTDDVIGQIMGRSYRTARFRGDELKRKFGVNTKIQVVVKAYELGYLKLKET